MTSLSDVYHDEARGLPGRRRLYAGTALLLAGAALAVLALVVGTTDPFVSLLGDEFAARELAGILGGLAVPTVLAGVFTVLPSGRRIRAAAAISASICLVGVALFWYAYPAHWAGHGRDLTFFVSAVYLVGLFSAVWCLFTAVANFKTRNNPGGTLEMTVTRGERVVEAEESQGTLGGLGGVGFLGSTPDGEVETQTGTDAAPASSAGGSGRRSSASAHGSGPSPAGDGGTTTQDIQSPLDDGPSAGGATGTTAGRTGSQSGGRTQGSAGGAGEETATGRDAVVMGESEPQPESADRYCGNCTHFEYVRDAGIVPYCRYQGERMEDMDACEEWSPNAGR